MAASHVSGPWYSEEGYRVVPVGSSGYYMAEDTDGNLKIGAGGTVGTNVAIEIDPSGNLTLSEAATDLNTDKISLEDGTAALPSYTFQSDPDTGFFRPGADSVCAAVGGSCVLEITATGIVVGDDSITDAQLKFNAGATGTALIAMGNSDGNLQITPHTSGSSGPNIELFGGNHATKGQDIEFSTSVGNIFAYDHSATSLVLGASGHSMSVYGEAAVVQAAHITDAPGDTAANNATTINAILVALENFGITASA